MVKNTLYKGCLKPQEVLKLSTARPLLCLSLVAQPLLETKLMAAGGQSALSGYYQRQNEMIDGFSEMDQLEEHLLPTAAVCQWKSCLALPACPQMLLEYSDTSCVC